MSEMVQRVAGGMFARNAERIKVPDKWDEANDYTQSRWLELARAAIEAMREPTEAMKRCVGLNISDFDEFEGIWKDMIDEALK